MLCTYSFCFLQPKVGAVQNTKLSECPGERSETTADKEDQKCRHRLWHITPAHAAVKITTRGGGVENNQILRGMSSFFHVSLHPGLRNHEELDLPSSSSVRLLSQKYVRTHASSWNTLGTKTAEKHQEGGKPVARGQQHNTGSCNVATRCIFARPKQINLQPFGYARTKERREERGPDNLFPFFHLRKNPAKKTTESL